MTSNIKFASIFVTVGTTEFDNLIKVVNTEHFAGSLERLSCSKITVQIGRGSVEPTFLVELCKQKRIVCDYYRFKPNLDQDMQHADLIITHCGAGSIIEALSLEKVFITVVNDTLQDNHQTELADKLSEGNYCISTEPNKLCVEMESLSQNHFQFINKFPKHDNKIFPVFVNLLYGL